MKAQPKKAKTPEPMTVSAYALLRGHDRRTLQRRLMANGVEPVKVKGRARFYNVLDLEAAAAGPDSTLGAYEQIRAGKVKQLVLKCQVLELWLADARKQHYPRSVAQAVLTQFVKEAKGRMLAGLSDLLPAVRDAADTAAAVEIAGQYMANFWAGMAKGGWATP